MPVLFGRPGPAASNPAAINPAATQRPSFIALPRSYRVGCRAVNHGFATYSYGQFFQALAGGKGPVLSTTGMEFAFSVWRRRIETAHAPEMEAGECFSLIRLTTSRGQRAELSF